MTEAIGKSSKSRERLSKLLREGGEVLTVDNAARILRLDNEDAAKALARWRNQGWLARIRRGVYVAVPLEAKSTAQALEDAWVLVPELFGPAYVGGWSAAEHWDLTEQIFRDVFVVTERSVTRRNQTIHNVPFVVTHAPTALHFGTKPVWIKEKKILVSDPTKTIVDMLSAPWTGGGVEHVADCLRQYLRSRDFDAARLIEYASRVNNGAVFKRLGFLASQLLGNDHALVHACEGHLSKGKAQLDPALKGDRLITRWRLFIPAHIRINGKSE